MYPVLVNVAEKERKDRTESMIPADVLKFPGRVDGLRSVGFASFRVLVPSVGITATRRGSLVSDVLGGLTNDNGALKPTKSAPPFLRAPSPAHPFFVERWNQQEQRKEKENKRGPRFNII